MPWFYAGPEAKPVGPISVEELHACRVRGTISAETYVIEQKAQSGAAMAWKRYSEVFPASPSLPPVPTFSPPPPPPAPVVNPPVPPAPAPAPASLAPQPPAAMPPVASPHPLFPSAAPIPGQHAVFAPGTRPDPYYNRPVHPTNAWCAWGFWLGLASFFLALACGLGVFVAPISVVLCIVGLAQVHSHREQGGQYQAIWGIILSFIALVIAAIFIFAVDLPFFRAHGLTVPEETSNDSE
jgi:hypothetical protein